MKKERERERENPPKKTQRDLLMHLLPRRCCTHHDCALARRVGFEIVHTGVLAILGLRVVNSRRTRYIVEIELAYTKIV